MGTDHADDIAEMMRMGSEIAVIQEERRACVSDKYDVICIRTIIYYKPKQHRLARSPGLSQVASLATPYSAYCTYFVLTW